jgi:hypothetical protein
MLYFAFYVLLFSSSTFAFPQACTSPTPTPTPTPTTLEFNEINNGFNSTCITDNDCFGNLVCGGSTGTLCSSCGPQLGENNGCTNPFQTICGSCAVGLGFAPSAGYSCLNNCA